MTLVLVQESDSPALRNGLCNCRPVLELLLMARMPSPRTTCGEIPVRALGRDPVCWCGFVKGSCSCSGCLAGADRPVPNIHVSLVPRRPERLNPSNQPGAVFTGPGGRDPAGRRGGCVAACVCATLVTVSAGHPQQAVRVLRVGAAVGAGTPTFSALPLLRWILPGF